MSAKHVNTADIRVTHLHGELSIIRSSIVRDDPVGLIGMSERTGYHTQLSIGRSIKRRQHTKSVGTNQGRGTTHGNSNLSNLISNANTSTLGISKGTVFSRTNGNTNGKHKQ